MKDLFFKYQYQLVLLAIGVLWLPALDILLQIHTQQFIFPDTQSYLIAAKNFYSSFTPDSGRPMLVSLINGVPYLFGFPEKSLFVWSLWVNIVLWLSTVLMLFEIVVSVLKNNRRALWFTLVYVFTIGSTIIIFHLLSETIFTFFLLAAVFCFQRYILRQKYLFLALGLSALLLSVLIKPVAAALVVFALADFGKSMWVHKFSRWNVFILISMAIVFFQLQTMKQHFGNYTISYIDSFTSYNYLGTRADCLKTNTPFVQCDNERYDYFTSLSLPDQKKAAVRDLKMQLTDNTRNLVEAYGIDIYTNTFKGCQAIYEYRNNKKTSYFDNFRFLFRALSAMQNTVFTLLGLLLACYFLIRKKAPKLAVWCSGMIVFVFLISGISSEQGDRFHLVFYPEIIIVMAFCYQGIVQKRASA
jgi:hypothetical protein